MEKWFVVEPGNGTVEYSLELLEKGFVVEPGNGTLESVFGSGLRMAHLAFAFIKVLAVEVTLCHPALAATGVAEAHSVWSVSPSFEACSVSVVFLVMFRHQDVRPQWSHKNGRAQFNREDNAKGIKATCDEGCSGIQHFSVLFVREFGRHANRLRDA